MNIIMVDGKSLSTVPNISNTIVTNPNLNWQWLTAAANFFYCGIEFFVFFVVE